MKKKIINGFLMVALLAATVTSFVSCKDNDEDVKTDLIAQLYQQGTDLTNAYIAADQKLNADLKAAYEQADADLKTYLQNWVTAKEYATEQWVKDQNYATEAWVQAQGYLKEADFANKLYADPKFSQILKDLYGEDGESGLTADVAKALAAIGDAESGLTKDVNDIKTDVSTLSTDLSNLTKRVEKVEEALKNLEKDFENLITSVNVNATSTTLLANSKIFPGLNVQFVGAAFGKAVSESGDFPKEGEVDINGNKMEADYIASGIESYHWSNYITNNDDNNAGKIYFTVNPSNIWEGVLNNTVKLSLTTSQNNEEVVTIKNVKASDVT